MKQLLGLHPNGSYLGMTFDQEPFGGHHLDGDSCPPTTFEVVC